MNYQLNLNSYSVVFLSYDEPCADSNYDKILSFIPWAQRVHGIKGSDTAHKECAKMASSDRVIIIDGDNMLHDELFFQQNILIDTEFINLDTSVISWSSKNIINDLEYGNGGIKCWPTSLLLNMKTHEHAESSNIRSQVDFCWDINYIGIDTCFSTIINNSTPYQAWRAGFREGVKLSLNEGIRVNTINDLWAGNINRLLIWSTVGADIQNGKWAIHGARYGCWLTLCTNWNYIHVRDFDEIFKIFNSLNITDSNIDDEINKLSDLLQPKLEIPTMLDYTQSKFFKKFNFNTVRQHPHIKLL